MRPSVGARDVSEGLAAAVTLASGRGESLLPLGLGRIHLMTKKEREYARTRCAECDRKPDAVTLTKERAILRCMLHWVAYYRRRVDAAL